MTEAWVDAEDYDEIGEAVDGEELGEGTYGGDDVGEEFGEESRSARRRRERQRQIMLARQRQTQVRRQRVVPPARRPAGPPGGSRPTITAIRSLDLETKVGQDSLRRAIEESNRRASRATWAAVASATVDQGLASFDSDLQKMPYVAAGARFAPLLFLAPDKKRGGFEGFVTDPRVVGAAAIGGLALLGHFRDRGADVDQVLITSSSSVPSGTSLSATALDKNGDPVSKAAIKWMASDGLTIDSSGRLTGAPGTSGKVSAFAGGKSVSQEVEIASATTSSGAGNDGSGAGSGSSGTPEVAQVVILTGSDVSTGDPLKAEVRDASGAVLGIPVNWASNSVALNIDANYNITGSKGAEGEIEAYAGGKHVTKHFKIK
jgi:hypothetical protein